jgi:hypothetical protein
MWPPQGSELPSRQPFQTFSDRRRNRTRRRLITLAVLAAIVGGVWLARPHFPGVEAEIRRRVWMVFHPGGK